MPVGIQERRSRQRGCAPLVIIVKINAKKFRLQKIDPLTMRSLRGYGEKSGKGEKGTGPGGSSQEAEGTKQQKRGAGLGIGYISLIKTCPRVFICPKTPPL